MGSRKALEQIAAVSAPREFGTLEFKEMTGTPWEATTAVCAFLNHSGVKVQFGVPEPETTVV